MSILKEGAPDLLAYLPGYPQIGAPQNISAIIRNLEERATRALAALAERNKDAERWRMLPAFLEEYQIDYVGLLDDVDAAIDDARALDKTKGV